MLKYLPENVSTFGDRIDSLFRMIYIITSVTFILVAVTMIAFLILYRQREGVRAYYTHGSKTLEIVWTVVPAIVLAVITGMSVTTWRDIKMRTPETGVEVRVIGKQFNWRMIYPGPDGQFETDDDLELANELHVPVNQNVIVQLQAEDVIHSFFLPHLRVKQDAIPGRTITVWFNAFKTGEYEIACAELCGFGHYNMRGLLTVHEQDDYESWMTETWPTTTAAAQTNDAAPAPETDGETPLDRGGAR